MQLFYTTQRIGDTYRLEDDDFRHCVKALRKKEGDTIISTDGCGYKITGHISAIEKRYLEVSVTAREKQESSAYNLSIAIAPTKNMGRFEWFLEKATEIGVSQIYPILTRYSERKVLKLDRCQKILISALKQSQQFYVPTLHEMMPIKDLINNVEAEEKFLAYVDHENIHLNRRCQRGKEVLLLIGPEGDFSKEEIDLALSQNYEAVSLGNNRLRTETAGIVGAQIIAGINAK